MHLCDPLLPDCLTRCHAQVRDVDSAPHSVHSAWPIVDPQQMLVACKFKGKKGKVAYGPSGGQEDSVGFGLGLTGGQHLWGLSLATL